jgi:hypothetical protein
LSDGKKKFIQNVWTKKSTIGGTRNVITASKPSVDDIRTLEANVGPNSTIIGLYQFGMGLHTKAVKYIKDAVVGPILDNNSDQVRLVNKKTGLIEQVSLDAKTKSTFLSQDGMISKTLAKLEEDTYAHQFVEIDEKHWLCNIYDDGEVVRIMFDNDLPEGRDKKYIKPISYIELITYAFRMILNNQVGTATRYPIIGQGSIYPTYYIAKSTTNGLARMVLKDDWSDDVKVTEWPKQGGAVFNSMSPHYTKLGNLDADFDGDKLPANIQYTDESIAELVELMNSRSNIVNAQNKYISKFENDISSAVVKTLNNSANKLRK